MKRKTEHSDLTANPSSRKGERERVCVYESVVGEGAHCINGRECASNPAGEEETEHTHADPDLNL